MTVFSAQLLLDLIFYDIMDKATYVTADSSLSNHITDDLLNEDIYYIYIALSRWDPVVVN
jgi:hypothetical protein